MASSIDFVEYVCEQLKIAGEITYKRMFGEYGLYCNEKFFALICEDQLFVKPTVEGRQILEQYNQEVIEESPYPGAKPHFVLEHLEDKDLIRTFIRTTYEVLPFPKPKKSKKEKKVEEERLPLI